MPRFRATIPVDDYVVDVLMRDLCGHDGSPAAFIVFLSLYRRASRYDWRPVAVSLRELGDETGLSKSAVQAAVIRLKHRDLIRARSRHATAIPEYVVLRHWRFPSRAGAG